MKEKNIYIMGKRAIEEVIIHNPNIFKEIFICKSNVKSSKKNRLINMLLEKNIKIKYVSKDFLYSLVGSNSHQSFVAKIKKREFLNLEDFLKEKKNESFVLMLDSIFDPQNMGSLIRSAECFKVDAVIFSKNRGSDITPVVSKTSCGATEFINLIKVSNLAESIRKLKKEEFQIIVSDIDKKSIDISKFKFPKKTVLIVGSEEKGVRELLKKMADHIVKIPMHGKITSLNVSQATAIFLYNANKSKDLS